MAAGYSGTPLVPKLGIKPRHGGRACSAHPTGSTTCWSACPTASRSARRAQGHLDLAISFQTARAVLERRLPAILTALDRTGALWVAWPKKASKVPTDITEDTVRDVVLPIGLVDVKVCAIDEAWSGLKVVWRRENR